MKRQKTFNLLIVVLLANTIFVIVVALLLSYAFQIASFFLMAPFSNKYLHGLQFFLCSLNLFAPLSHKVLVSMRDLYGDLARE